MIAQTLPFPIQMCFEATNLVLTLLDILSSGYVVILLNTCLQGLKIIKKVVALECSSKSLLLCCSNPMQYM